MKLGKILKRGLIGFAVFILLLIGTAIAIPYFFKDEIVLTVKQEINNNLNADIDFNQDIGLTLFRSFPDLSVTIKDLAVTGKEPFKGLRLASIKDFDINLDLMSVINGDKVEINSFAIDGANIYVKVLRDGRANYDIALPSEDDAAPPVEYQIQLESYSITNSKIIYDDEGGDIYAEIVNLNHKGSGDLSTNVFDLATKTNIDALTVNYGGISYISGAEAESDLTINVDLEKSRYEFKENDIRLNALKLETDGFVEMPGKDIIMDLNFRAPQTDFKYLLSMIPNAFTSDFKNVDASGKMALRGSLKGRLDDKNFPGVNLNLEVDKGTFKYPDLPLGVQDINTKITVKSPEGSNLDLMTVNVPTFHMKLGNNPIDAVFMLKNPMSDPDIKAKVKGTLKLDELSKAFPLEGVEKLSGLVKTNLDIDTRMSYVEKGQYDRLDMKGDLSMKDVEYIADGTPRVKIIDLQMDFSPEYVNLPSFFAKLGKSDIKANGRIDNILAYFSDKMVLSGKLDIRSDLFDANEWLTESTAEDDPTANYEPEAGSEPAVFDRFDFTVNADMKKILYEDYTLVNTIAKGNFKPNDMTLTEFSTKVNGSDIRVSGSLQDVFDFLYKNKTLKGNISLASNNLNLNKLMGSTETETTTSSQETTTTENPVPENIDLTLDADLKNVLYEDYNLSNTIAKVNVRNNTVTMTKLATKIGESDISASGKLENVFKYVFENQKLTGTVNLVSNNFNLNQFATEEAATTTTTTEEAAGVVPVPENMELTVNADIDKLQYDNMTFRSMKGSMAVKEQRLSIDQFRGNSLGGAFGMTGYYDTKKVDNPDFKLNFNLDKLSVKKSFETLNSIKQIAPIAQYIEGLFSTELVLEGKLLKDMSLDYNSLTGNGFVTTIDAIVRNFKPLAAISGKLGLKELNEVKLSDTKNWIELKDGKVIMKPADHDFKEIGMRVGGEHAITSESMKYDFDFKVPRKLLENSTAGAAANSGMKLLGDQAAAKGIDIKQGENINFKVGLTGSMKSPKIDVKFIGSSGKTIKEEIKEEVKEVAQQKLEEAKDQVKTVVEDKVEETKAVVKEEIDKAVDKAKEQVKEQVKDKVSEEVKDKINDKLDEETKKKLEDLKDKFPWKKKKGGN